MASKRHARAKACGIKKRYTTVEDARNALFLVRHTQATFHGAFDVYHCRWCHGFHFGHRHHDRHTP